MIHCDCVTVRVRKENILSAIVAKDDKKEEKILWEELQACQE